jgi:tetratricopeptide (TPR) repeat protein
MRKRVAPVGIPSVHGGEDVKAYTHDAAAGRLLATREESSQGIMLRSLRLFPPLLALLCQPLLASPAAAGKLSLPPNTFVILDHIYSGRRDLAIPEAQELQREFPANPLGYLLEAEALWWRIWCASADYKYGMTTARHREKLAGDQHYFELMQKASSVAEANLHQQESAEMDFYAGMAEAGVSRLDGLRGENRAGARAAVRAREHFLRALALDPTLSDAYCGLGLYNYYVDTLSTLARVLRFFMGIPGGSKEEGIRQLKRAIDEGQLTPPLARFYLAMNLHGYDQRYEEALQVSAPLAEKYPQNPIYQLMRGDLYAKLNRKQLAEASYRATSADIPTVPEAECRARLTELVRRSMAAIGAK